MKIPIFDDRDSSRKNIIGEIFIENDNLKFKLYAGIMKDELFIILGNAGIRITEHIEKDDNLYIIAGEIINYSYE